MTIKQKFYLFSADSLLNNSFYLVANNALGSITGFGFWLIAARLYSAEEIGLATTILSVIGFISLFSDLGFTISLIKYIPYSENNRNNLINTCFTVSGIITVILSVIFILGVNFFSPELSFLKSNLFSSFVFIFYTVLVISVALQDSVFIALRKTKMSFLKICIQSILKIPLLFIFVTCGPFGIINSLFLAYLLATLTSLYILIPKISLLYKPLPTIDYFYMKQIIQFSVFNFIARIFESIPSAALPLLITNILDPEKTAFFYMAWMIAMIVYVIPLSISKSLFAEGSNNQDNFLLNLKNSIKISIYCLIPITIIFFICGDNILSLFGKEYSSSGLHLLWILLLSGIPYTFNNICLTVTRIENDIKLIVLINSTITTLTLVISYFTLNKWGIVGVGVGWLLSQCIVSVPAIFYLYSHFRNLQSE